jgi:outer membrane protein OmpA-like peptidoglycan-associated protein
MTIAMAGVLAMGALGLSACATKEYVNDKVAVTEGHVQAVDGKVSALDARVSAHDARLAALDASVKEALDRATAAGKLAEGKFIFSMVLSDEDTRFKSGAWVLSDDAKAKLSALADRLKSDNKNVYLEIQGHTDSRGSKAMNLRLGEARAEAVRRVLNDAGVALNRMSTISYGDEKPVASNKTRDGRAQNRRVVIVVLA